MTVLSSVTGIGTAAAPLLQSGGGGGLAVRASYAIHLLFAGLWAGGAALVAVGLVPLAADSTVGVEPAEALAGTYVWVARAGALVTLLTGAHMAWVGYGVDGLLAGTRGHLVLGMVVLWAAFAGLSEVGVSRFRGALSRRKVRTAAADARPFLAAAAVAGGLLLLVGGYLAA